MTTLKYNGQSYVVDHAVKGADYINGYDANGIGVISIQNIKDFSAIEYDGVFMNPEECAEEPCNIIRAPRGILPKELHANPFSVEDVTKAQVRNIYAGTADMTPGVTTLATGDLYVMYE